MRGNIEQRRQRLENQNPYELSEASLMPPALPGEGGFLREPRKLSVGAGVEWFSGGWNLFAQAPGVWIGLFVIWFLLIIAVSLMPIIGGFAGSMLGMVLSAGVALGCRAQSRGETLEISHLFAGFSTNFNQLLLVGLIYVGATIVITLLMLALVFLGLGGMGVFTHVDPSPDPLKLSLLVVAFVVAMLLLVIPLAMSTWFAPPLVALENIPAVDAMKLSLHACLRNFWVIVVYCLLAMVAVVFAAIPLFLGFLVLAPVLMATTYVAYRQMFYND